MSQSWKHRNQNADDEVKKPEPEPRKRKRERDPHQQKVNTANSQLKWWLVKVPKYLGQKWIESPQSEVGTLQVTTHNTLKID